MNHRTELDILSPFLFYLSPWSFPKPNHLQEDKEGGEELRGLAVEKIEFRLVEGEWEEGLGACRVCTSIRHEQLSESRR